MRIFDASRKRRNRYHYFSINQSAINHHDIFTQNTREYFHYLKIINWTCVALSFICFRKRTYFIHTASLYTIFPNQIIQILFFDQISNKQSYQDPNKIYFLVISEALKHVSKLYKTLERASPERTYLIQRKAHVRRKSIATQDERHRTTTTVPEDLHFPPPVRIWPGQAGKWSCRRFARAAWQCNGSQYRLVYGKNNAEGRARNLNEVVADGFATRVVAFKTRIVLAGDICMGSCVSEGGRTCLLALGGFDDWG